MRKNTTEATFPMCFVKNVFVKSSAKLTGTHLSQMLRHQLQNFTNQSSEKSRNDNYQGKSPPEERSDNLIKKYPLNRPSTFRLDQSKKCYGTFHEKYN